MTFLDTHLIIKIRDKVKAIDHIGFIWLDRPIYDKKVVIDRIKLDPYEIDEILPISWYAVSPKHVQISGISNDLRIKKWSRVVTKGGSGIKEY
jgi:hypothetical protein